MKKSVSVYLLGLSVLFFVACDQKTTSSANETASNPSTTAALPVSSNSEQTTAAVTTPTGAIAKIEFDKMQHDFGNLKEGDVVKQKFKFKNVGDVPLVISNVQPQCGCTTTNFTKTPVAPNSEGEIELQFDSSGKSGPQHKTATVFANVEGGQTQLVLTAIVDAKQKLDGPFLKK